MERFLTLLVCSLAILALSPNDAQAGQARTAVVLDSKGNVRSFYGVPLTLTQSTLKRLPFRVRTGHYHSEGTEYTKYTITAQNGIQVEVEFRDDGKLYGAETRTANAVGPKGIGVGSTLADVTRAWPGGMLRYGSAHGPYVTYLTGTNVLLRFDPNDMPPGAFDLERPYDFPVPDNIKVEKISIYPEPNPIPATHKLPDPNKADGTVQTTDGKIISKLEVERTPATPFVRITWTHQGKVKFDRMIDVSEYPGFDIWSRQLAHKPDPVVVSFRYGNFKNCAVREDDRDQVYVTLDDPKATISLVPPIGLRIMEDYPMRKYVGGSMNSEAHGCRRTYDPHTGAFGLERVE